MSSRTAWKSTLIYFALTTSLGLAASDPTNVESGPAEIANLDRAKDLRSNGHLDDALDELTRLYRQTEKSSTKPLFQAAVLREMGEIYAERKDLPRAAEAFEKSLGRDPQQGVVYYELALVYRDLGDSRKAAAHLESAIQNGFRNLSVTLNLISSYFASHQAAAALTTARAMVASNPSSRGALVRLGQLLFEHLYYADALQAFQAAFDQASAEFEPRFYLALTHYLLRDYPRAAALLSSSTFTGLPEVANLLAASEASTGEFDKAAELLESVIAKHSRSPHAYLNLALIRLEQGRPDEAERLLADVRALGAQSDAKVFYAVRRSFCPEAVADFQTNGGIQLDREKAEFYAGLARQMQNGYNYGSALALLRLAHAHEGNTARLLYAAGVSCLNISPQAPEAIWLLRQAVRVDPNSHETWHLLGRAQLRAGNFDEALADFRRAVSLQRRAEYLVSLGKTLQGMSEDPDASRREALALFTEAVSAEPTNALAQFELGRVLSHLKQFDSAKAHLSRALELEPDFYEAAYVLGQLFAHSGDREQAARYLDLFEKTKAAVQSQAVIASGYVNEGRNP
jgi:tetratricopeptide (TPR) repeat protein